MKRIHIAFSAEAALKKRKNKSQPNSNSDSLGETNGVYGREVFTLGYPAPSQVIPGMLRQTDTWLTACLAVQEQQTTLEEMHHRFSSPLGLPQRVLRLRR